MAPQLEASGAEPTLANCVQTALRILAAAPGMGSSRRPAYKGGFIHRGRWRQGGWQAPSIPQPLPPPLQPELGTGPGRRELFVQVSEPGERRELLFRTSKAGAFIRVPLKPPPMCAPPPPTSRGQMPSHEEAGGHGTGGLGFPARPARKWQLTFLPLRASSREGTPKHLLGHRSSPSLPPRLKQKGETDGFATSDKIRQT